MWFLPFLYIPQGFHKLLHNHHQTNHQDFCKDVQSHHHHCQTNTYHISHAAAANKLCNRRKKTKRPASADRTAHRQFQAGLRSDVGLNWWLLGKPVFDCMFAVIKLFRYLSRLPRYEANVCNARASNGVGPFASRYQGNGTTPANILIPLERKGNWLRYNFAADTFYIMKLCSRLLVLYCRNCPKDDKFRYFIPILRKLGTA